MAYIDDLVLIVKRGESQEALNKAIEFFSKYGLEISKEKSKGTHLPDSDGNIEFIGQTFNVKEPKSLAP